MGRKRKEIIDNNGVDKRDIGYYSTPNYISEYLTKEMLALKPNGELVLDPAVGKEELLSYFYEANKKIEAFDIIEYEEYKYSNFYLQDFIEYYSNSKKSLFNENTIAPYDYYIANPPYNCHEIDYIKNNKALLKKLFPDVGVYNMYSMFLSAMIDIAKEGALIGVIISDSFLTAKAHAPLRSKILNTCSIHQIILCPNDLFQSQKADVRTCIMILQKGISFQKKVSISNRPQNKAELENILYNKKLKSVDLNSILLSKEKDLNQFVIDVEKEIIALFHQYPHLENLYKCVTSISTGNDEKYLSKERKEGYNVPFYKNPARNKFICKPDAYLIDDFMEESLKVSDFMVRNKSLLNQEGIVCSSMGLPFSACYLPKDAVSGVNPTIFPPSKDLYWLMAYLNSSLVTYLVRGVLIRSNMVTSGYINKLPIIDFNIDEKENLKRVTESVLNNILTPSLAIEKIDEIIFSKNIISSTTIKQIADFNIDLYKKV